jgi:RimJ/RimL family protein N-acetyltransferase
MTLNKLQPFKIVQSLTDTHINQLVRYSREDQDVLQFTRDAKRFEDSESTKTFIERAHVWALIDNDQLCGIIWFDSKPIPEINYTKHFDKESYDTTFAIRLYGNAKGKALSFPFMEEVFTLFYQEHGQKGLWLQTRAENTRAIHLYQKFGFRQISEPDNENRIVMVQ